MPGRAVIYGNIVPPSARERLLADQAGDHRLDWREDDRLFEPSSGCTAVFVDLDDPRFAAPEFLVSLATAGTGVKVVGKSDHPTLEETLRVSKLGVAEVLTSEQCLERLRRLLAEAEEISVDADTTVAPSARYDLEALIGSSRQMAEIRKTVKVLSTVDFPTALILGETGTGKSLVCRVLHHTGLRAANNLVEVNCSAIPDELFESELFGHVRGAFTDAHAEKTGLFEYAQDGTLFLDEVGNLSASAQAKLLKVLEDRKLRKVGGVEEKDISVRVIAATNVDLHQAITDGRFREDLYFRLNLLTIEIPPLRERPEDIPDLIDYYLRYYAALYRKGDVTFSRDAVELLQAHSWPGNIRELCNVIERAVLLTRKEVIGTVDIRAALKRGRVTAAERQHIVIDLPAQGLPLDTVEQQVVKYVLDMFNWNKTETARFLHISRPRLRRIIQAAGLERNRRRA